MRPNMVEMSRVFFVTDWGLARAARRRREAKMIPNIMEMSIGFVTHWGPANAARSAGRPIINNELKK